MPLIVHLEDTGTVFIVDKKAIIRFLKAFRTERDGKGQIRIFCGSKYPPQNEDRTAISFRIG